MEHLKELELSKTKISDASLAGIKTFSALKSLSINDSITDQGLRNLQGAHSLEGLSISSPNIRGEGLAALKDMPYL